MYIIDETYFIREYNIPDTGISVDLPQASQGIEYFIDKYARQLLQNVLGNVLFEELDSFIVSGKLKNDAPQKWKDLVQGKSYERKTWKGLSFEEGVFKGSLLVPFVYFNWLVENNTQMSSFGEVKSSATNSNNVNPTSTSDRVWNEFIKQYQGEEVGNTCSVSVVNGVPFYDYYKGNESGYVSLVQYLQDNQEDYPDATLKLYDAKNYLGL